MITLPTGNGAVVVPAPARGHGNWAGAPSAVVHDGVVWLAYRVRRADGRGRNLGIARSADGVAFDTVAELSKDAFGAESLERPALVPLPDGGWRLFVSCATPGTKHWWVDAIDAADPSGFDPRDRVTVFPGDDRTACKDPVVTVDRGPDGGGSSGGGPAGGGPDGSTSWRAWVCVHPLDDPEATDRMSTWLATSDDGLAWTFDREVLAPRPGEWDARGARVTAVLDGGRVALYDGRATAAQNFDEHTGLATIGDGDSGGDRDGAGDGVLTAVAGPARVPSDGGSLRYATVVEHTGVLRCYVEAATPDGSHHLTTEVLSRT